MQPSENGHLPNDILKLFSGRNEQEVGNIIQKIQDEIDKIWAKIDKKYEKCVTNDIQSKIFKDFKAALKSYLRKEFGAQAALVNEARLILEDLSFGIIFCNKKQEMLAVKNHYGSWSAVKGWI
ncbi:unnamed protein product [Rotaria sp. Silwood1]|nr:unnamed protein product [Rotaria sp. Silwood1]